MSGDYYSSKCYWDIADRHSNCGYGFEFNNEEGPKSNGWKFCPNCGKPIHEWNSDMDYTELQVTRSIKPVETDAQSGERE